MKERLVDIVRGLILLIVASFIIIIAFGPMWLLASHGIAIIAVTVSRDNMNEESKSSDVSFNMS